MTSDTALTWSHCQQCGADMCHPESVEAGLCMRHLLIERSRERLDASKCQSTLRPSTRCPGCAVMHEINPCFQGCELEAAS